MESNGGERRPADISNSYVEFVTDDELERAIAEAAARHPANAHSVPAETSTHVVEEQVTPTLHLEDHDT